MSDANMLRWVGISYGITVELIRRSRGASLQLMILGKSVLFTEKYLEPFRQQKMNDLSFHLTINITKDSLNKKSLPLTLIRKFDYLLCS